MSLPWSEMMNLINLDNERNPAPSAIVTHIQPTTPSHRYNPYKKPSSVSNETVTVAAVAPIDSDLAALHRWIDKIMAEPDVPEPDFFKPVATTDSAGNEIRMKNPGKDLIRPLRDYSGLFDPSQPLPENPNLPKGKGRKQAFWFWLLQLLIDPSMREIAAWTGRGREFIILNDNAIAGMWSRHEGRTAPVKFDSIRRTIRTHYKRDILIPADTKSRKNRRWAFYTEPSIHVGMTREELSAYIAAYYNTTSSPSSDQKTIEEVPAHHYPAPAPSTEYFFNFSAPPSPNSQFQVLPPPSYPHHFTAPPPTAQFPEFSIPHPEHPSHVQSPPAQFEQIPHYSIPPPTNFTDPSSIELQQMPEYSFPWPTPAEMPQSPEPVIDQPIANADQPESLPVLDINEFDLEFDASWNSPVSLEDLNEEAENGDLVDGLFF